MEQQELVVYEPSGVWTRILRRRLNPFGIVRQGPALCNWRSANVIVPTAVLIVVESGDDEAAIQCVDCLGNQPSETLVTAVIPDCPWLNWRLRCVGSTMVWDRRSWPTEEICRLIRRFWSRIRSPTLSLEDRIWKNLPWDESCGWNDGHQQMLPTGD